jgi:hypothetical protein
LKKIILIAISLALLLTACSPASQPASSESVSAPAGSGFEGVRAVLKPQPVQPVNEDFVKGINGFGLKSASLLCGSDANLAFSPVSLELALAMTRTGAAGQTAEEMKSAYQVLTEEFSICNFQLQMGRPRVEVLHELGARTGVSDLRALAAVLIQADKFGSSIAQALRTQSDSLRTRRRQMAEEKAAKTAVKLIFPLVIFIFPGIFVVLVGPAAITMVREMFPKMGA